MKGFLTQVNRPFKAVLLLDNALSCTKTNDFKDLSLPPNCTVILHPMDPNLIQNVKVNYKKQLLQHILSENYGG